MIYTDLPKEFEQNVNRLTSLDEINFGNLDRIGLISLGWVDEYGIYTFYDNPKELIYKPIDSNYLNQKEKNIIEILANQVLVLHYNKKEVISEPLNIIERLYEWFFKSNKKEIQGWTIEKVQRLYGLTARINEQEKVIPVYEGNKDYLAIKQFLDDYVKNNKFNR